MSSLLERMMKSGKVKEATLISESKFFDKKDLVDIGIPILNVAFSADIDGGMSPGLTVWAGQSKTFKTLGALISAAAYQRKHDDGLIILYDTEFGITPEYLTSCGIDNERVLHIPIESVEQLKFDMIDRLENIEKGDHVMFVIDSIGMLASKKEVEDAIEGKAVADMTRAKALKSLFRLVTSKLTILEIPCIAINHTYADIGSSVPREIVGGGCVVEGTEIVMADGSLREIQLITEGELVMTADGPKEVLNSWDPDTLVEGTPECFEVEFDDGTTVVCSEGHMFFRDGIWVQASELNEGDSLSTLA